MNYAAVPFTCTNGTCNCFAVCNTHAERVDATSIVLTYYVAHTVSDLSIDLECTIVYPEPNRNQKKRKKKRCLRC